MRTGVDIVDVGRIERVLISKRDSFYKKIFTDKEIEYIKIKKNNTKTVSGLFAAKESVSKLLGVGIGVLNWKDIEVLHDREGRPFINKNIMIENYLRQINLNHIEISISHEKKYAICFAIGF